MAGLKETYLSCACPDVTEEFPYGAKESEPIPRPYNVIKEVALDILVKTELCSK